MSFDHNQIERLIACQGRIQRLRDELRNPKDMSTEQLGKVSVSLADRVDEMLCILINSQPKAK
jgi:hypothetical protein